MLVLGYLLLVLVLLLELLLLLELIWLEKQDYRRVQMLLNRGCLQELLGTLQMLLLLGLKLHVRPTELAMSALHFFYQIVCS